MVANGGTGATTAKGAQNALLSDMQTETTAMDDTAEFVMKKGIKGYEKSMARYDGFT